MNKDFNFGEDVLTAGIALQLSKGNVKGVINKGTRNRIDNSRNAVQDIIDEGKVIYGINTGFGPLCSTIISKEDTKKLQYNILRSHSVGVGEPVSREITRLMMITKVHALAQGYAGISLEVLERILWHIENDITPLVPSQGSLGASGDLAPLAHLFLPLLGLGSLWYDGEYQDAGYVLQKEGLKAIELGPKEGLALINGTQFIVAFAIKAVQKLHNCLEAADIIGAMSLEGILGSASPFDEELNQLRPFSGAIQVAHRLRTLLEDSEMVASHIYCNRVQDPYSIRCMPQVHGASRNAWLHLKELLQVELNAVTDNPVIFNNAKTISGGNFHGQLLALPLDYCTVAASELGNISDRRTYLLLEGKLEGLPTLLMSNTGINSGFMIPQYTSAALVSENKGLCFPASADSIPTSLGQEDHVSMGSVSGRKINQVIENLENILAIELLCAAQAFDFRKPMRSGKILDACHSLIRSRIDHAEEDRIFSEDIKVIREIIISEELVKLSIETARAENLDLWGPFKDSFTL